MGSLCAAAYLPTVPAQSDNVSRLVMVPGIVTAASKPKACRPPALQAALLEHQWPVWLCARMEEPGIGSSLCKHVVRMQMPSQGYSADLCRSARRVDFALQPLYIMRLTRLQYMLCLAWWKNVNI